MMNREPFTEVIEVVPVQLMVPIRWMTIEDTRKRSVVPEMLTGATATEKRVASGGRAKIAYDS